MRGQHTTGWQTVTFCTGAVGRHKRAPARRARSAKAVSQRAPESPSPCNQTIAHVSTRVDGGGGGTGAFGPPVALHEKAVCEGGTAMLASLNHEKAVWPHGIGEVEEQEEEGSAAAGRSATVASSFLEAALVWRVSGAAATVGLSAVAGAATALVIPPPVASVVRDALAAFALSRNCRCTPCQQKTKCDPDYASHTFWHNVKQVRAAHLCGIQRCEHPQREASILVGQHGDVWLARPRQAQPRCKRADGAESDQGHRARAAQGWAGGSRLTCAGERAWTDGKARGGAAAKAERPL
eukprot:787690-Prymnesium_polylepis.1